MDLLRIVLSRLPLQNLVYRIKEWLSEEENSRIKYLPGRSIELENLLSGSNGPIDRHLLRIRLRDVNHLEEPDLELMKYIRICVFQGELCDPYDHKIAAQWLLSRAAFLEDLNSYYHFPEDNVLEIFEPNIALHSPDLRIRLLAASRYRSEVDLPIIDPESIPWTDDLRRLLLSRLEAGPRTKVSTYYLIGYLRYPGAFPVELMETTTLNIMWIFRGYVQAVMLQTKDPFTSNPLIDNLATFLQRSVFGSNPEAIDRIVTGCGYFAHANKDFVVKRALANIYPQMLERNTSLPSITTVDINSTITITKSLVERADQMLKLSDRFDPYYRNILRILTGRYVNLSGMEGLQRTHLAGLMFRVAHPQLTSEFIDEVGDDLVNNYEPSIVLYDLVNYFRVREAQYPIQSEDRYKLHRLFAIGGTLRIRSTETFEQNWIL